MLKGFVIGVCTCLALGLTVWLVPWTLRSRAVLSCHQMAGEARYCVHSEERRGLFSRTHRLLIGPDPARGVVYGVPWPRERIATRWDPETGDLTIELPGSTIVVTPGQYLNNR